MNAVERLWTAAAERNWAGVRAQLAPGLRVDQPATGVVLEGADSYVTQLIARLDGDALPALLDVVSEGKHVAAEVDVRRPGHRPQRCAQFVMLVEGRITRGVEYWVAIRR